MFISLLLTIVVHQKLSRSKTAVITLHATITVCSRPYYPHLTLGEKPAQQHAILVAAAVKYGTTGVPNPATKRALGSLMAVWLLVDSLLLTVYA
jgi:hypothetical protein